MPDSKITALTAITTVNPATFPLVIVDTSDTSMAITGTTKKVTTNQLLGAGGTATLASATITGDLTVDTSTLKVDSANNRVGIGTASPHEILTVANTGGNVIQSILTSATGTGNIFFATSTAGANSYRGYLQYDQSLNSLAFGINSTTAMTLNSTGLGVGKVPASNQSKVQIYQALGTSLNGALHITDDATTSFVFNNTSSGVSSIWTSGALTFSTGSNAYSTNGARMTLDGSGTLLVGTTSSLQNTSHSFKALGTSNSFWASTFQHDGTVGNPRLLGWRLPNSSDSNAYFVYAINSGGNCFNVFGNGSVTNSTGTYGTISDLRLKENISDARNYLSDLLKLRVVKYSLKSEQSSEATKLGFIAQEVEQVFPTLVETNGDDVKSIKTTVLIPMLLKALQELTARVQTLETR